MDKLKQGIEKIKANANPDNKITSVDEVINRKIGGRGFDTPKGYYGVEYKNGKLYAGGITNSGIFHDYEIDYDHDQDLDVNLQRLYELFGYDD